MASSKKSASWRDIKRVLASKSQNELLNLIRDLYALTPENRDFIQAQALAPKASPSRTVTVKDVRRGTTFEVVVKGKTSKATPKRPFRPFSKRFVRNSAKPGIHPRGEA